IAEIVEGVAGQQVNRLGSAWRALHRRPEDHVADLDATVQRGDAQVTEQPQGAPRALLQHRVEQWIAAAGICGEPGIECAAFVERAIGQIVPQRRVRPLQSGPQVIAVACGVECLQTYETARQRTLIRRRARLPVAEVPGHQNSFLYWMKPERSAIRS